MTSPPPSPPAADRRLPMALLTWAFVALVLVIVVVLVVLKVTRGATAVPPPPVAKAPSSVVQTMASLPPAAFDAATLPLATASPTVLTGQPPLQVGGRPAVVFVGAEFSPYSAVMRWALVAALDRFGSFSDLGATASAKAHVFPHTATFTFDGAGYRSATVSFVGVEEYAATLSSTAPAGFPPLHSPSPLVSALLRRYDGGSEPTFPFVDVGNRVVFVGAQGTVSPQVLQGLSMSAVAADVARTGSPQSTVVLGEADAITAAICAVTGDRPAAVCDSAGVQGAAARIGLG